MANSRQITDPTRCIKCGFCMSVCPLYKLDHKEGHVARGRHMLIKAADTDPAVEDSAYKDCLFHCLLCGRCETVCPAKISTVAITQKSRSAYHSRQGLPLFQRLIYRNIFRRREVMARGLGLAAGLPGLSSSQGAPLRHMADITSLFSSGVSIPRLSKPFLSQRIANRTDPAPGVDTKGKVGFFPGCSFEFFFAGIGETIVHALSGLGYQVIYPKNLSCCGLAVNSGGDAETAQSMAKKNIELLSEFDHIITGCATCGSTLKEYVHWFEQDDAWREKSALLSQKVRDFSEFVVGQKRRSSSERPERVTFHDPCHLRVRQGVFQEPREILKAADGVDYVEMDGADACCGLGGAFGLKNRDASLALQKKKMENIRKTGAQTVVTSCPGCMIQLLDGVRRYSMQIEVKHIGQYL